MAGLISNQMLQARELIEAGKTPYRAAKESGLSPGAITRSPWYKERVKPSLEQACAFIRKGYTPRAAAEECKITLALLLKSEQYAKLAKRFKE